MSIPERSSLPAEFMALLEQQDAEKARTYGRKPVLPAVETPQVLVDAAMDLDHWLGLEMANGERAAEVVNTFMRARIDAVLRREVVEPMAGIAEPNDLHGTGFHHLDDLHEAYAYFVALLDARDNSSESRMAWFRRSMVMRRKLLAERFGVELDLTDEQWWEL